MKILTCALSSLTFFESTHTHTQSTQKHIKNNKIYKQFEHDRKDSVTRVDEEVGLKKDNDKNISSLSSNESLSSNNTALSSTSTSSSVSLSMGSTLNSTSTSSLPLVNYSIPTQRAYFRHAQIGYVTGLIMSITASMVFGVAQVNLGIKEEKERK
jgi:hypothetical protein